jgi:hypothetical protein
MNKIPKGRRAAWFTADYLLGRRFEFVGGKFPDVTVTGFDPDEQRVRVHALDGAKQWVPFDLLYASIFNGGLVESDKVSFVHPR